MFQNLKSLINPAPIVRVKIRITRNCLHNGQALEKGEVLELPESTANELIGSSAAELVNASATRQAQREALETLLPPAEEPTPAPELFTELKLPECFGQWWDINIQGHLLERRAIALFDRYISYSKGHMGDFSLGNCQDNLDRQNPGSRQAAMAAIGNAVSMTPPSSTALREMQYLRDEMKSAEADVSRWSETNRNRLAELHFRCSEHTIAQHGELVKSIRELHRLGFELFETRISALQLGESQARRLFQRSRDQQLFAVIQEPGCGTPQLAWYDPASGPVCYLRETPPTQASLLRNWQETYREVCQTTRRAMTELAAAKKVSAAA